MNREKIKDWLAVLILGTFAIAIVGFILWLFCEMAGGLSGGGVYVIGFFGVALLIIWAGNRVDKN